MRNSNVAASAAPARKKRLRDRLAVHFLKNAVCCGIPAGAIAVGLPSPWHLSELQEYGIAVGVAAAVTVGEAAYTKLVKHRPLSLRHMASDFAVGSTVAIGLMWAVHAAGLHPHHDHHHHSHEAHSHESHSHEQAPKAQTPLRPATIPGVFTPPSHDGHDHEHDHEHEHEHGHGHSHGHTHHHDRQEPPAAAPR